MIVLRKGKKIEKNARKQKKEDFFMKEHFLTIGDIIFTGDMPAQIIGPEGYEDAPYPACFYGFRYNEIKETWDYVIKTDNDLSEENYKILSNHFGY